MRTQSSNLSTGERAASAAFAALLSWIAIRRSPPLLRLLASTAAASLVTRAVTGHCAVKAAVTGRATKAAMSACVDESVRESFPASDPPSSHLPDEPPVNAGAKWAAARAAGEAPE